LAGCVLQKTLRALVDAPSEATTLQTAREAWLSAASRTCKRRSSGSATASSTRGKTSSGPGVKIDRDRMRPSLVLLDARGGRLLAEGRLPEPLWRLSLRHLAIGRNDVIAVAA
jgi:uncharacterized protein DUF1513